LKQKRLVLSAILAGMSAAVGFLFMSIPNFEFFLGMIFISGFLVGPRWGIAVGCVATLVYSGLNPYGMAAPPLLLAQLFCYGLTGFCGGCIAVLGIHQKPVWIFASLTLLCGVCLTLLYDILTTLSFAVFMTDNSWPQIQAIFVSGLAFYAIHLAFNAASFATLVPLLMINLENFRVQYE